MDLVLQAKAPLAWDHNQMPFDPPEEAVAWKVRRGTGRQGRPPAVYADSGVLHLGLDAGVEDLRRAVKNKPGVYKLYPVDASGNELTPIAFMEIVDDDEDDVDPSARQSDAAAIMSELLGLCGKMVASRDAHDDLIAKVLTTLVTTTATIQRSTANLLTVANSTIQVANGVEPIERKPVTPIDQEKLVEQLVDAIQPEDDGSGQPKHWAVELLSGPVGVGLFQVVTNFANVMQANMAAQAQAKAAAESKPEPEPPAAPETDDA